MSKNKEWAMWLWNKVLQTKKVGDSVHISKSQIEHKHDVCGWCYEPTSEEIGNGKCYQFDDDCVCEKHKDMKNL